MVKCDNLTKRRTIYTLGKNLPIEDSEIIKIVEQCVLHCPTAFNVQSARTVILFQKSHEDFWKMVEKAVVDIAPSEKKEQSAQNVKRYTDAYATILFYEDTNAIRELEEKFPLYSHNMKTWAIEANGMLEYMIWQKFAENKIGASLQHYNELIEDQTRKHFNLPSVWKMIAQMPFGSIEAPALEKTFLPLEERIKIFS